MNGRLSRRFFARPTLQVARALLGVELVRRLNGVLIAGRVVEVEAYVGPEDSACHASRGRTARTEVMFGLPGHAYVYFTYGVHWMLNVVTERQGFPAAVLIRAVEPTRGLEVIRRNRGGRPDRELTSGPARLCQAFAIDRLLNGADVVKGKDLFLRKGVPIVLKDVTATPRVGIDYAAPEDRRAPWRFYVTSSPHVSCRAPAPAASGRARRGRRKAQS